MAISGLTVPLTSCISSDIPSIDCFKPPVYAITPPGHHLELPGTVLNRYVTSPHVSASAIDTRLFCSNSDLAIDSMFMFVSYLSVCSCVVLCTLKIFTYNHCILVRKRLVLQCYFALHVMSKVKTFRMTFLSTLYCYC